MSNIAEKLEGIIDRLDTMSSTPVPRTYGLDIASRVEHIANQLDGVESGGSSGGGVDASNCIRVKYNSDTEKYEILDDYTFEQLFEMFTTGKLIGAIKIDENQMPGEPAYNGYDTFYFINTNESQKIIRLEALMTYNQGPSTYALSVENMHIAEENEEISINIYNKTYQLTPTT